MFYINFTFISPLEIYLVIYIGNPKMKIKVMKTQITEQTSTALCLISKSTN